MADVYISWSDYEINEEPFNPNEDVIPLLNTQQKNAAKFLKENYSELFTALFDELDNNKLKLKLEKRGYLGTNSRSKNELLLRTFLNDNSSKPGPRWKDEKFIKPISLSRDSYKIEVYRNFCVIISGYGDNEESYGWLDFTFDDTRGYVVSDGEEEWDAFITIDEDGVFWGVWDLN